ncbi:MAG TPA: GntR family transcriptional regulator [Tepidisphaeraceae bacterium]|jgi:DNA-binding transcriptional regulator YhcF (GntR family)|nr:GntR family transcriptional regulator [Tepidisphaeraceae bacterium]
MANASEIPTRESQQGERLSYKFQRLRERLRDAVVNGELAGKLPGERELARRFKANPKTLSKALTDLAAEGLLERSIGRGTYVKGSSAPEDLGGRWLVLVDEAERKSAVVEQLLKSHSEAEVAIAGSEMRPSFISQFNAVIDLSKSTPESFHKDLLVRGISILLLGREPASFKVHAVLLDRVHAASCLARDIFLAGHRRILVLEDTSEHEVSTAVRAAAARYAPHAAVDSAPWQNTSAIIDRANSAILCDGEAAAVEVHQVAESHAHVARVSWAAVGTWAGTPLCTGIYVTPTDLALAATNLLRTAHMHRPTILWITGTYVDRSTIRAVPESRVERAMSA